MKLADRPTPETDRNTWDADLGNMVVYADIAKSLEQRLAIAVAALNRIQNDEPSGVDCMVIASEALAQIEGEK